MITFLYGPNDYEIKQRLKKIVVDFLRTNDQAGLEKYDATELDNAKLPEIFQSASLFSAERLILIEGTDKNKTLWNALEENLKFIPDSTEVIITAEQPDKRTKTFKILTKKDFKNFEKLKPYELEKWLVGEAKNRGGNLTSALARKLIEQAGDDQWRLSNELDKLLTHGDITAETIDLLVEPTPQQTIFQLLDAVITGRVEVAKKLIDELRLHEDPYQFFGLLSKQIHILAGLVAKIPPAEVAKTLKAHPFVVQKLTVVANKTSWRETQLIIEALAQLDTEIKTSGHDPWTLVEKTCLKIASR